MGAHVGAGHRLAEDVGALQVQPLGLRVTDGTGGPGGVEFGGPGLAHTAAGIGRDGVGVHRGAPVLDVAGTVGPSPSICWTSSTSAAGALAGEPASNGGCGSYSMASWIIWAISGPFMWSSRTSAMSMPLETPAAVMT